MTPTSRWKNLFNWRVGRRKSATAANVKQPRSKDVHELVYDLVQRGDVERSLAECKEASISTDMVHVLRFRMRAEEEEITETLIEETIAQMEDKEAACNEVVKGENADTAEETRRCINWVLNATAQNAGLSRMRRRALRKRDVVETLVACKAFSKEGLGMLSNTRMANALEMACSEGRCELIRMLNGRHAREILMGDGEGYVKALSSLPTATPIDLMRAFMPWHASVQKPKHPAFLRKQDWCEKAEHVQTCLVEGTIPTEEVTEWSVEAVAGWLAPTHSQMDAWVMRRCLQIDEHSGALDQVKRMAESASSAGFESAKSLQSVSALLMEAVSCGIPSAIASTVEVAMRSNLDGLLGIVLGDAHDGVPTSTRCRVAQEVAKQVGEESVTRWLVLVCGSDEGVDLACDMVNELSGSHSFSVFADMSGPAKASIDIYENVVSSSEDACRSLASMFTNLTGNTGSQRKEEIENAYNATTAVSMLHSHNVDNVPPPRGLRLIDVEQATKWLSQIISSAHGDTVPSEAVWLQRNALSELVSNESLAQLGIWCAIRNRNERKIIAWVNELKGKEDASSAEDMAVEASRTLIANAEEEKAEYVLRRLRRTSKVKNELSLLDAREMLMRHGVEISHNELVAMPDKVQAVRALLTAGRKVRDEYEVTRLAHILGLDERESERQRVAVEVASAEFAFGDLDEALHKCIELARQNVSMSYSVCAQVASKCREVDKKGGGDEQLIELATFALENCPAENDQLALSLVSLLGSLWSESVDEVEAAKDALRNGEGALASLIIAKEGRESGEDAVSTAERLVNEFESNESELPRALKAAAGGLVLSVCKGRLQEEAIDRLVSQIKEGKDVRQIVEEVENRKGPLEDSLEGGINKALAFVQRARQIEEEKKEAHGGEAGRENMRLSAHMTAKSEGNSEAMGDDNEKGDEPVTKPVEVPKQNQKTWAEKGTSSGEHDEERQRRKIVEDILPNAEGGEHDEEVVSNAFERHLQQGRGVVNALACTLIESNEEQAQVVLRAVESMEGCTDGGGENKVEVAKEAVDVATERGKMGWLGKAISRSKGGEEGAQPKQTKKEFVEEMKRRASSSTNGARNMLIGSISQIEGKEEKETSAELLAKESSDIVQKENRSIEIKPGEMSSMENASSLFKKLMGEVSIECERTEGPRVTMSSLRVLLMHWECVTNWKRPGEEEEEEEEKEGQAGPGLGEGGERWGDNWGDDWDEGEAEAETEKREGSTEVAKLHELWCEWIKQVVSKGEGVEGDSLLCLLDEFRGRVGDSKRMLTRKEAEDVVSKASLMQRVKVSLSLPIEEIQTEAFSILSSKEGEVDDEILLLAFAAEKRAQQNERAWVRISELEHIPDELRRLAGAFAASNGCARNAGNRILTRANTHPLLCTCSAKTFAAKRHVRLVKGESEGGRGIDALSSETQNMLPAACERARARIAAL